MWSPPTPSASAAHARELDARDLRSVIAALRAGVDAFEAATRAEAAAVRERLAELDAWTRGATFPPAFERAARLCERSADGARGPGFDCLAMQFADTAMAELAAFVTGRREGTVHDLAAYFWHVSECEPTQSAIGDALDAASIPWRTALAERAA